MALAIDPQTSDTVYAGPFGSGIFKSVDGGLHWSAVFGGLTDLRISDFAIDPETPTTLYAGSRSGMFKSTNGGASWSAIHAGLIDLQVSAVAIDPVTPSTIYAATRAGVFKSLDRGETWAPANAGLGSLVAQVIVLNRSGTCLHAGTSGVFSFGTRVDAECLPPPPLRRCPAREPFCSGRHCRHRVRQHHQRWHRRRRASGRRDHEPWGGRSDLWDHPACRATDRVHLPGDGRGHQCAHRTPGYTNQHSRWREPDVRDTPLRPTTGIAPTDITFAFNCTNTDLAPTVVGLNTLLLSASADPVPDIIALATTLSGDGIVNVSVADGIGVFAVATTNVGASGVVTVSADTGPATLPLTVSVCETNVRGACVAAPAGSVTRGIDQNETPTFGLFVTTSGSVPFDPATHRIFVRFKDSGAVTRGSTSVAVRSQ